MILIMELKMFIMFFFSSPDSCLSNGGILLPFKFLYLDDVGATTLYCLSVHF